MEQSTGRGYLFVYEICLLFNAIIPMAIKRVYRANLALNVVMVGLYTLEPKTA